MIETEAPELVEAPPRRTEQLDQRTPPAPRLPVFDAARFRRALGGCSRILAALVIPLCGLAILGMMLPEGTSVATVLGLPLYDWGVPLSHFHTAFGLIAFGALAAGFLACGFGAVGIVAVGLGAVGLVAVGGGAVGLIAVGGGSWGYIAIGGRARGRWVLARSGRGRFVFSATRQDPEAVAAFTRYFPRLGQAYATPTPEKPRS